MSRNVWGYWDCKHCDTKKLRGDVEVCPNCGAPRAEDTKFYMDLSTKEYVDEEKVNTLPNWICSFCNSQNEGDESVCEYCGASRSDSQANYFEMQQKLAERSEEKETAPSTPVSATVTEEIPKPVKNGQIAGNNLFQNKRRLLAIGLGIALIAGFLVWCMIPVQHQMTINSVEWIRQIETEKVETVDESGWSLPSQARLKYKNTEIRSYNQVVDHYETKTREVKKERVVGYQEYVTGYEDLGNGQFREETAQRPVYETYYETETYEEPVYKSVPVYDTKYYYEIDKWVKGYPLTTSGTDKNPVWGQMAVSDTRREGKRTEAYYILGMIDGENQRFELSYSDWMKYDVGDIVVFKTLRFSNEIIDISDIVVKTAVE